MCTLVNILPLRFIYSLPITVIITKSLHYTLQEHQWILTNATVSKESDFEFIMVVYEKFFKNILKYLKEIKKYVSKLMLHKNIK